MKKRTTSWNLLDFLLIGVSGMAMANRWQSATSMLTRLRPLAEKEAMLNLFFPEMLAASVGALVVLLLVLRQFDSLAERLVGTACIWGMWYFVLDMLFANLISQAF